MYGLVGGGWLVRFDGGGGMEGVGVGFCCCVEGVGVYLLEGGGLVGGVLYGDVLGGSIGLG